MKMPEIGSLYGHSLAEYLGFLYLIFCKFGTCGKIFGKVIVNLAKPAYGPVAINKRWVNTTHLLRQDNGIFVILGYAPCIR